MKIFVFFPFSTYCTFDETRTEEGIICFFVCVSCTHVQQDFYSRRSPSLQKPKIGKNLWSFLATTKKEEKKKKKKKKNQDFCMSN